MSQLPTHYLDSVVSIGFGKPGSIQWSGTGFFYGRRVGTKAAVIGPADDRDWKSGQYHIWLITNKHVVQNQKKMHLMVTPFGGASPAHVEAELISRNGKPRWIGHPDKDVDVAAVFVPLMKITTRDGYGPPFFADDLHVWKKSEFEAKGFGEGAGVFVLGFPMGMVGLRQYAICRQGVVARIRDCLHAGTSSYLVDASVFPGNSGGPVITRVTSSTLHGTPSINEAALVGLVKAYVPYEEVAISTQTGRPRVAFQENSGLGLVEHTDSIAKTVDLAETRLKGWIAQQKYKAKKRPST